MGAFDAPGRGLGRGRHGALSVQWGNEFTKGLAFLFVPHGKGYIDLVRGDIATLQSGTTPAYDRVTTPVGPGWWLSRSSTSKTGFAATRTGDSYYQQSAGIGTLMAGNFELENPGGATRVYAGIFNSASSNTGSRVLFDTSTNTPNSNVGGGGGNTSVAVASTFGIGSNGYGFVTGSAYDGATLTSFSDIKLYATSGVPGSGAKSGTGSVSRVPSGMNHIRIGVDQNSNWSNSIGTWFAGWFGTVWTVAQMTAIAEHDNQPGRLPSCLAARKGFSHL